MHYSVNAYATSKDVETMKILNPDIDTKDVGTGRKLSEYDVAWVNKLYDCVGKYICHLLFIWDIYMIFCGDYR